MIAKKNKMIVARISKEHWEVLNNLAKADRRTLSDFVRIMIEDKIKVTKRNNLKTI